VTLLALTIGEQPDSQKVWAREEAKAIGELEALACLKPVVDISEACGPHS
jgi:hypothetical protein